MTFCDLQQTVERLAADSRVHSTTPVQLACTIEIRDPDGHHDRYGEPRPLVAIMARSGVIELSPENAPDAFAR